MTTDAPSDARISSALAWDYGLAAREPLRRRLPRFRRRRAAREFCARREARIGFFGVDRRVVSPSIAAVTMAMLPRPRARMSCFDRAPDGPKRFTDHRRQLPRAERGRRPHSRPVVLEARGKLTTIDALNRSMPRRRFGDEARALPVAHGQCVLGDGDERRATRRNGRESRYASPASPRIEEDFAAWFAFPSRRSGRSRPLSTTAIGSPLRTRSPGRTSGVSKIRVHDRVNEINRAGRAPCGGHVETQLADDLLLRSPGIGWNDHAVADCEDARANEAAARSTPWWLCRRRSGTRCTELPMRGVSVGTAIDPRWASASKTICVRSLDARTIAARVRPTQSLTARCDDQRCALHRRAPRTACAFETLVQQCVVFDRRSLRRDDVLRSVAQMNSNAFQASPESATDEASVFSTIDAAAAARLFGGILSQTVPHLGRSVRHLAVVTSSAAWPRGVSPAYRFVRSRFCGAPGRLSSTRSASSSASRVRAISDCARRRAWPAATALRCAPTRRAGHRYLIARPRTIRRGR